MTPEAARILAIGILHGRNVAADFNSNSTGKSNSLSQCNSNAQFDTEKDKQELVEEDKQNKINI